MIRIGFLLLAAANVATSGAAERDAIAAARACASHQDAAARLACYDDVFGASVPPAATPAPKESSELSAQERFGMHGEVARELLDREAAQKPQLEELQAEIVAIDWLPRGEFVVTLDNGQVWTQKRRESIGRLKVGDTVTIRAGALGSFRMSASSARATNVERTK